MLFNLSWRNLWRNKRRTFITMASIIFAVLLAVLLNSVKEGVLFRMQENVVSFYTGAIQVHQNGYWEEKTLDNSFTYDKALLEQIESQKGVNATIGRLESFALGASNDNTRGCMVVGIEAEKEPTITSIDERMVDGTYLLANDNGVLVAEGMANYLKLGVNDTLVIIGQGYHGQSAAGKFPIKGLVQFASLELNRSMVYMTMGTAQRLFGMEGRITAIVLGIDNVTDADAITAELSGLLPSDYEVMGWKQLMPELDQLLEAERSENIIFLVVLYMLIAFGIFGTVLMMTLERQYEFGVLIAIGMRKLKLSSVVIMENIMISVMGALIGTLLSIPVIAYFYFFPIQVSGELKEAYESFGFEPTFYFSVEPNIFYSQTIVVLCIALVLSVYPLIKIMSLDAVTAMRI